MAVLYCPRCQRTNPEIAVFCYFDGAELRSQQGGGYHRLGREFVFPSGTRCRTFDEFVRACRDEWPAARDLLREDAFRQFFGGAGRTDLAKAAQEAMAQSDADIALTRFLDALPISQTSAPKIDINPRRLALGSLLAGERRQLQITVSNLGEGKLQGTLTVKEGFSWLKIDGPDPLHGAIATGDGARREQKFALNVDTRGLPAGGAFGAKLTVITNGGAVEIAARMELVPLPFTKAPFEGAKTPRDMAERMRKLPKAAAPILENGEVARWFTSNGWNFPVRGPQAKGVAGVQQFFETMGLSKPPEVHLTPSAVRLACAYPGAARAQVTLRTAAKKWVYGAITSDSPWLRVLTPQVGGPQQAPIVFEVDARAATAAALEGKLQVLANGGKTLALPVSAEIADLPKSRRTEIGRTTEPVHASGKGSKSQSIIGVPVSAPRPAAGSLGRAVLAVAIVFFMLRLLLVAIVDWQAPPSVIAVAAAKLGANPSADSTVSSWSGWLQLPWVAILTGSDDVIPARLFRPSESGDISAREFGQYFSSYLLRWVVLWTGLLGAVLGAGLALRGSGPANLAWGAVAGAVAGIIVGVTAGCSFLVLDILPHAVWERLFAGHGGGLGWWFVWVTLALACWTLTGAVFGLALGVSAPCRRVVVVPLQTALGNLCRFFGLRGLAQACGTGP